MSHRLFMLLAVTALAAGCSGDRRPTITLGVPTTIQDSGLLESVLIEFQRARPDTRLRYIAAGSGELLALGRRGDLDVLLAHSPDAEREFVEAGYGLERHRVMENDFIIVGPPSDPARIRGMHDAAASLSRIADAGAQFLSRGDDSGTHRKELELWASIDRTPGGPGYRESGRGMGDVLRAASELSAYALCDRATFTNLKASLELAILVEGDPRLLNVYSVTIVAGARQLQGARAFAAWLLSDAGQRVIAEYGVEKFEVPLFFPAAREVRGRS